MKQLLIVSIVVLSFNLTSQAQYVRVRVGFPAGISVNAPGPRPHSGAVWIGPEWQWRGGRYHAVPGYWTRPHGHHPVWVPGYWKHTRRGYKWIPGRWRY